MDSKALKRVSTARGCFGAATAKLTNTTKCTSCPCGFSPHQPEACLHIAFLIALPQAYNMEPHQKGVLVRISCRFGRQLDITNGSHK